MVIENMIDVSPVTKEVQDAQKFDVLSRKVEKVLKKDETFYVNKNVNLVRRMLIDIEI